MNDRQMKFADKYIETLNGKESAIFAGYKEKTARNKACELLKSKDIKDYIEVRMESKSNELIASQDEILIYLTKVLRAETTEEIYLVEGVGEGLSRAKRYDKHALIKDRLKAAELLGKRYALYTEKIETADEIKIIISSKKNED